MTRRPIGLETEYGLGVPGGIHPIRCQVLDRMVSIARKRLVHLPACQGSGIFLANGSRFYIDTGGHPEFCTPEVEDPWELIRYIGACDRILFRLATETASVERIPEIVVFKCHVDYDSGCTWGCHENFANKASKAALPLQLIPHLATRIVFSGAGGLNPRCQGIQFVLSPRTCHLEHATCTGSTGSRGIYHHKDEPLSGCGWSRAHLLCGESVQSHHSMLLKAGTTALVIALVEAGFAPGESVRLKSPIDAMHAFNADPSGRVTAPLANGDATTALVIQRHYLEFAEAHLGHDCMPAWAPEICRCWRHTLDQLDRGLPMDRVLDWAIKQALYQERIRRRGCTAEHLAFWNELFRHFKIQWDTDTGRMLPLTVGRILSAQNVVNEMDPRRRELGLAWEQADEVFQLRAELCELEIRFSALGPKGLFNRLDHAGHLRHALPGIPEASIEAATVTPPARGRAGVRGQLIREFHGQGRYSADWAGICDLSGRLIDLSDPFVEQAPPWAQAPHGILAGIDPAARQLAEVDRLYNRGDYEAAWHELQPLRQLRIRIQRISAERTLQLTAWVQSRRGFIREALQALDELSGDVPPNLDRINDMVSTMRFDGLIPKPDPIWPWILKAQELFAQPGVQSVSGRFAFLGHMAAVFVQQKRLDKAHEILQEALALAEAHNSQSRVLARNLCDLAEVHRLRDEPQKARECLERAQRIQTANHYEGDFAEFNLPRLAKLPEERARAKAHLNQARLIQRRLQHRVGMARTVLLQARLFPSIWHNQRRKRILLAWQRAVPMLQDCPLMRRILANWQQWVDGASDPGEEFFRGL